MDSQDSCSELGGALRNNDTKSKNISQPTYGI